MIENIIELSKTNQDNVIKSLASNINGLDIKTIKNRQIKFGINSIANEKSKSMLYRIYEDFKNPLNILLFFLACVSYFTNDIRSSIVILAMIVLGTTLRLSQEAMADKSAQKLKSLVCSTATVIRNEKEVEVPIKELVPGDIINLAAGDMVPADIILLNTKDLFINQSALTGEAMPVEKTNKINTKNNSEIFEIENIAFLGSNVISGSATAIVVNTGNKTYFGSLAKSIINNQPVTSFDKGINKFTWMMIRFMLIMVPLVFLVNGLVRHDWLEAFLFSIAIAVGLTPELMPMIVSVNLSKGAIVMSKKKVIVKRLNSIQNFGAMDILCTDKTGTITEGKTSLENHLDILGKQNDEVLKYGFLNSFYHTGLKSILDDTILSHGKIDSISKITNEYEKVDEIPFDFDRKRMSVIIEDECKNQILICKGAFEEIIDCCSFKDINGVVTKLDKKTLRNIIKMTDDLNSKGYRVVTIAYKKCINTSNRYIFEKKDENDLVLLGFLSFFDPPKESSSMAIKELEKLGIKVKILTGDNDKVTKHVCEQVDINANKIIFGSQIESMTDEELKYTVEESDVFVKLAPSHKDRIILALQKNNHVVGFMGDGINDAPALKTSDIGISVNSAVDIAKETSDIILLNNSLLILKDGVLEGRRVFGNITKYIKMAASSNFGNMFSIVGASAFLPFLPMLPIQVLTNNLLYDLSQTTIPTDKVDREWLKVPRKWTMDKIEKYVLIIGPISSIFDYITFFVMLNIFNCWNNPALFHTGWFIESIITQTLIIHVIRTNKIPFIESRASKPLLISTFVIIAIAIILTQSPIAKAFGFTKLPLLYWGILIIMMISYLLLTQLVKMFVIKRLNIQ